MLFACSCADSCELFVFLTLSLHIPDEDDLNSSSISWQPRLAVLTSFTVCFANPNNPSIVLDDIPLHEIQDVGFGTELDDMIDAAEGNSKRRSSRRPTKTRKNSNAMNADLVFYIQTSEDGKNSGRSEHLSHGDDE